MRGHDQPKQHDELISELIQLHQESSRRLKIMENVQAILIPVLIALGIAGLASFLKVFGAF